VREFIEAAFGEVGVKITWQGSGVQEVGVCANTGQILVKVDPAFFRPAEVDLLVGDSTEIREKLGWVPKCTFGDWVKDMMKAR
jgi:GDPmannose 4,6-dehydratase